LDQYCLYICTRTTFKIENLKDNLHPGNCFRLEPAAEGCRFIAEAEYRVGKLARILAGRKLEEGLASAKRHMKEEGENLKKILENTETLR